MGVEASETSREEKQRACEAILKSRTFSRSEQLQAFLKYICELELAGRGDEITEYSIAITALGRRADYAPNEDSSVRSRAHALRRKLQEFYETEGAPDPQVRIELPKGSYRPLFVPRDVAAPAEIVVTPEQTDTRPLRQFIFGALSATAITLLAVTAYFFLFRQDSIDPVIREAWEPLLGVSSDVLVVLGCPPVARIVPSAPGKPPWGTVNVPAPAALADWYAGYNLENRGGPYYMFPTRGYTLYSDTLATAQLGSFLNSAGVTFQAVPEVGFRPTAVHERGLVLIGSPAYTAFIGRVQKVTPFAIRFDPDFNDEAISDGPPGQAATSFRVKRDITTQRFATIYGLITVLPAQPGRERPQRTVVFSGIMGSPGAQAGVQYFTSAAAMGDLKARFRREGFRTFPPAYQVVVRCSVDNDVAINVVYQTHRVMKSVPVIE
jgi:hypothetical protein